MSSQDASPGADRKADRLREYLREAVEAADGELYCKSKFVADDLDLTPKQVGTWLRRLQDRPTDLSIEKWSYTNATTWRITRSGSDGDSVAPSDDD